MKIVLILFYIFLTIYGFIKKREYVLATILVGQPLLKLMIKPLLGYVNEYFALIIYFSIGFYTLLITKLHNREFNNIKLYSRKTLIWILAFLLTISFSLMRTPDKEYGLNKILEFLSTTVLIVLISILTINNKENLYRSMNAIANMSIIIGILTVILIYMKMGTFTARIGTTQSREIYLLGVNFAVSIWFGRRMGIALLAMLSLLFIDKSWKNIIKTCILCVLVMLSGSRGPIFSMIGTIILVSFFNILDRRAYRKGFRKILVIMLIILGILLVFTVKDENFILNRVITFDDSNVIGRKNMYSISINLIKQNLLGHGVGSFFYLSNGIHDYPHNIILEVLVEQGIHGLIVFLIPIYLNIKYCIGMLKNENEEYMPYINFVFSVLFFALFNAQFSGNIASNEYIWLGIILASILQDIREVDKNSQKLDMII